MITKALRYCINVPEGSCFLHFFIYYYVLQLLRDRQIVSTGMVLTMQRTESKTLSVMFSPYYIGPVNGKITIKHYTFIKDNSESQPYKRVCVFNTK